MRIAKLSLGLLCLSLLKTGHAWATGASLSAANPIQQFEWVELSNCRVPRVKPPRVHAETDDGFSFQRRFLALEGEGRPCVLLETYIERLDGSDSPGMRATGSRAYRFERGRWRAVSAGFRSFPYAVRRTNDQQLFFVEAVLPEDVGDSAAVGGWYPSVSHRVPPGARGVLLRPWRLETTYEGKGAVLQGLAVLLASRLRSNAMPALSAAQQDIEHDRIRKLLESAWTSIPPAERVPVDADGLPK